MDFVKFLVKNTIQHSKPLNSHKLTYSKYIDAVTIHWQSALLLFRNLLLLLKLKGFTIRFCANFKRCHSRATQRRKQQKETKRNKCEIVRSALLSKWVHPMVQVFIQYPIKPGDSLLSLYICEGESLTRFGQNFPTLAKK